MTPKGFEEARRRYILERPAYQSFANEVADRIRLAAATTGLDCEVKSRAKDIPSFVKKAIRTRSGDPWDDIHDKAGVRIIVPHSGNVDPALEVVQATFGPPRWVADDRKTADADRLSYTRVHVQIEAMPLNATSSTAAPMQCEVQIRSEASDLWSRMSHSYLYKPEVAPAGEVKRSLFRLLALVELYDSEVERAVQAISTDPLFYPQRVIAHCERLYHSFCAAPHNVDLTFEVVECIINAVPTDELTTYGSVLSEFVKTHRARLEKIYQKYGFYSEAGQHGDFVLVGQPESVMIFERLDSAPYRLHGEWEESLPDELFEEMRRVWG